MKQKLVGLFIGAVLALVCLLMRVSFVMFQSGEQYARQVLSQTQAEYSSRTLPFKRGEIQDRNGTVLATSEKVYNLIFDCYVVNSSEEYADPTVKALSDVYGLSASMLYEKLSDEETRESRYQILLKNISIEQKKAFEDYRKDKTVSEDEQKSRRKIAGVWFEEDYLRKYPFNSLACDLIGFTYDGKMADWGIEGFYNNTLNGVDGRRFGYWEAGDGSSDVTQTIIDPVDGCTVVSTIDANVQSVVEETIEKFNSLYSNGPYSSSRGAENVGVVVMNPNDGSILAMGSSDPYDLNHPRDLSAYYTNEEINAMNDAQKLATLQGLWRNFCISDIYEPGSVFKPITMAAALESATLFGDETFYCDGSEVVSGTRIKCANNEGHGEEDLAHVIANSCNDAMMQIASKVGVDEFCAYQSLFGFGARTGIDLSGEASGILYTAATMGSVDLAISAFGQGFECSMIQEASAISSIINGGSYYRPRVVSRILDMSGATVRNMDKILVSRTVSADTSTKIKAYMKMAVDEGGAGYAKVNGYSMGGKTGTSQKIPRADGKYLVSFIGFVPYEDPQVLIYVVVDELNQENQADNRFPQWIARDILKEILPYLNIYQDEQLLEENDVLRSGLETPLGEVQSDTIADTNVPEVQGSEDPAETAGGNNQETEGYTNEEAGLA